MYVYILVNAQKRNYSEIVPKKSDLKVPGGLQGQQTLTAWPFSNLMGGFLIMAICITNFLGSA